MAAWWSRPENSEQLRAQLRSTSSHRRMSSRVTDWLLHPTSSGVLWVTFKTLKLPQRCLSKSVICVTVNALGFQSIWWPLAFSGGKYLGSYVVVIFVNFVNKATSICTHTRTHGTVQKNCTMCVCLNVFFDRFACLEKILNALQKQVLQNDIKREEAKFLVCTCSTCAHRGFWVICGGIWPRVGMWQFLWTLVG